ncbi:MAG: hypothetical protein HY062_04050 [Bacteroidetes bacterium]|nr:hypothetical protein [Bacteroidota bacterium]
MSLLNNIATYLLSAKESPKTAKQFVPWKQLSNVLIIAYDNQLSHVVDFINTCQKDKIKVHVAVIFDGKPEQAPKPNFEYTILDKKQFNFFGLPTETAIRSLSSKSADVLINLGNDTQIKALALSKLVPAKCKISTYQNPVFDMSIDGDQTTSSSKFLEQVIVYLHMIKTTL